MCTLLSLTLTSYSLAGMMHLSYDIIALKTEKLIFKICSFLGLYMIFKLKFVIIVEFREK
jgi:hypothetical protein